MNQLALELNGPRLSRQCAEILTLLKTGPATNHMFSGCSLKYTSRVTDLRRAGYDIRVIDRNHRTGVVWYALFVNGKRAA
jgi:hypothetical protein